MTQNIACEEKWIFEVRNGVMLGLGERCELASGWWFSAQTEMFGPFETDQQALDAADAASDPAAMLNILESPELPLPVTDPGEVFPLFPEDAP
jgi:hypothetical protein